MSDDIIARPAEAIRVQTAADLQAALETATGGETIVLAEGDYGHVNIEAMTFDTDVTLVSEAPQAARMTGFIVEGVSNLVVEGMFFDYVGEPAGSKKVNRSEFRVNHSENVTIRDSLFEGAEMDRPGNSGHDLPTGTGLRVYKSEGVLIEDNEIRTFWKGMKVAESDDTIVRGNEFHDLRSDGLNTTRSQDLLVEANHFHDFRGNRETGDHMDFIQMYTTADGPIPKNIVFKDNYLDMGEGSSAQGIFLQHPRWAETARGEELTYENVVITGNVVISGSPNGIVLNKTHGAVVTNNVLLEAYDDGSPAPRVSVAGVSTDVTLAGNVTHGMPGPNEDGTWGVDGTWTVADNLVVSSRADFEDIFVNGTDVTGVRDSLAFRPGGPADGVTVGAPALAYDPTPETLVAMVEADTDAVANAFTFDGTLSAGPEGPASEAGARFHWDFGDGTTATGQTVDHAYGEAGTFTTTLTVTMPDGRSDTSTAISTVGGPDFLSYDAQTGAILVHEAGATTSIAAGAADDPADGAGGTLHFVNDTMIRLPEGLEDRMEGAEGMTLTATLRANAAGMIFNGKAEHSVSITEGGELDLYFGGPAAVTDGADLLDGAWHDIAVTFDGAAGTVTLAVDDAVWVVEAPVEAFPDGLGEELKIGAPRGRGGSFTGEMAALDIDLNTALYDFAARPAPTPDVAAAPREVTGRMEIGTVTTDQDGMNDWHQVTFDEAIPDARVVMGPVSAEGWQPAFARVRDVTDTGFRFQIDEWGYHNGKHVTETVSWMAASAGEHRLETGQRIAVGRVEAADDRAVEVALDGFETAPDVLAQVTSFNGGQAVTTRLPSLDADSFELRMQEEEASSGRHRTETLDWIAIGEDDDDGGPFDFDTLDLDHDWQHLAAPGAGDAAMAVLAGMQTAAEADPAVLRYDRTGDGVALRLQEDQSRDRETDHAIETVAALVTGVGGFDLYA